MTDHKQIPLKTQQTFYDSEMGTQTAIKSIYIHRF